VNKGADRRRADINECLVSLESMGGRAQREARRTSPFCAFCGLCGFWTRPEGSYLDPKESLSGIVGALGGGAVSVRTGRGGRGTPLSVSG
jgi:hypothetical protein